MISLVLYGRNDSYGYNLHKRVSLSLNCMSEVLSDPGDEILFVDYNTPDDFPTFPEAIQDTLTDKAKRHLRILRVRPTVHARLAGQTISWWLNRSHAMLPSGDPIRRIVGYCRPIQT